MHSFTTKIYRKVMKRAEEMTKWVRCFEEIAADQIYFFLEVSMHMCEAYSRGQTIVIEEIDEVTKIVQKS